METQTKNIKYPYIPEGRTLLHVPEDNKYMQAARVIAYNESSDKKTSTGVVVVNNEGIILVGSANKSALTNRFLIDTHKNWCIRKIFKVESGKKYWLCPGCASGAFHAESYAMSKAKKKNIDVSNCDVYLWGHWWCCRDCWNSMINSNIRNVYLMEGAENGFNNSNTIVK